MSEKLIHFACPTCNASYSAPPDLLASSPTFRCDCGHEFDTKKVIDESPSAPPEFAAFRQSFMKKGRLVQRDPEGFLRPYGEFLEAQHADDKARRDADLTARRRLIRKRVLIALVVAVILAAAVTVFLTW